MNVLVAFWQGDDDDDVVFVVGQVRQLLANRPRTKNKQVWLSVPENCSDTAFFCHPWALGNDEGTLAVADELEECYAVCSERKVSIPVDSDDDDDAEEDDVSERVVCASPIVTTGFSVDWTVRPPEIDAEIHTTLLAQMCKRKRLLLNAAGSLPS
jgi:hypothetical protein